MSVLSRWRSFRPNYFPTDKGGQLPFLEAYAFIACPCGHRLRPRKFFSTVAYDTPKLDWQEVTCACGRVYRMQARVEVKEPIV